MRFISSVALCLALLWLSGCHSKAYKLALQRREQAITAESLTSHANYKCNYSGNGIKTHLDTTDAHCDVTWEVSDHTMGQQGHVDVGLLLLSAPYNIHDTVKFKHKGHEKFTYQVRSNPNDLPDPPPSTPQEQGCDASPIPPSPAANLAQDHYDLGAVQQAGSNHECHYKLTFEFVNPNIQKIDPHIAVGKRSQ